MRGPKKFTTKKRVKGHPLLEQLLTIVDEQPDSIKNICIGAGYAASMVHRWANGMYAPKIAPMSDILNAMGYELKIMKKSSSAQS